MQAEFSFLCGTEVKSVGIGKFTQRRVSGLLAQALPQENSQEWYIKHHSQQTLVHLQKRTASNGKEEGNPPHQATRL